MQTIQPPSASVAAIATALIACWPRTRSGRSITPASFAHAISDPDSDTAPINAPASVTIDAG